MFALLAILLAAPPAALTADSASVDLGERPRAIGCDPLLETIEGSARGHVGDHHDALTIDRNARGALDGARAGGR